MPAIRTIMCSNVSSVATYEVQLAQVSALHGLTVVSPGWPSSWWEREG